VFPIASARPGETLDFGDITLLAITGGTALFAFFLTLLLRRVLSGRGSD
jgi:hypothetical protein